MAFKKVRSKKEVKKEVRRKTKEARLVISVM